jgi:hypothetical protein
MPCIDIIIIIVIDVSNSTARKQLIQEILDGDALSTIVIGETGSGKTTRTCVTHHVMWWWWWYKQEQALIWIWGRMPLDHHDDRATTVLVGWEDAP